MTGNRFWPWRALGGLTTLAMVSAAITISSDVAKADVKEDVGMELAFIKRVFQTGYAPAQWKREHLGWDLESQYQQVRARLNAMDDVDVQSYRSLVAQLLNSVRDYHVGFSFYSTESASLPFIAYGVNGRWFVTWVDNEKLADSNILRAGDEILTWNGRPISEVAAELQSQLDISVPTTDARLRDMTLTTRRGSRGQIVPNGRVDLDLKRDQRRLQRQFTWEYTPETIDWNPEASRRVVSFGVRPKPIKSKWSFLKPKMKWEMWQEPASQQASDPDKGGFAIGGRKSYLPRLGTPIWESSGSDKFDAYIYRHDDGRVVGYIRIPHYSESGETFKAFRELIRKMESVTDALVIDQINNPGGSVMYVLALMSVLGDQATKVPDHHISLWPAQVDDILTAKSQAESIRNDDDARAVFGEDLDGYPVNYQFAQSLLQFSRDVETAWKAKSRVTRPLHLWGVDKVNPDPEVNYTKPILVIVNELDFSGGDFFPAILQDNHRARIFGQRTSGAGGYVFGVQYPSSLGLQQFSFTGSLARRVNDQPIENLGVTPDVLYTLTERDLAEGFADYVEAINREI